MTLERRARIDWAEFVSTGPYAVAALSALRKAVDDSGLDRSITELIKVRASQLNGCAFCLQFHLNNSRKLLIAPANIDLVATWREVGAFSAGARAALVWTEALTLMSLQPATDAVYAGLRAQFSEIASLATSVSAINAWNRTAGALRFAPPVPANRLAERALA